MFDCDFLSTRRILRLGIYCAAFAALGCGARVDNLPHESNTNWLKSCDAAADGEEQCGNGFVCACGVCTKTCDSLACPSRLTCLAEAACEENTGASCQATCESDTECNTLAPNMKCEHGVCVASSGLTLAQVSSGVGPDGSVAPGPDDETKCRLAYVEYPVGARVPHNGCGNSLLCECDGDGEWTNCTTNTIYCPFASAVRPCSEMFPGVALDDLPSDPYTIQASSLTGTNLSLLVSHAGGCSAHDFALCFAPLGEAYPSFVDLRLIHDSHGESCDAQVVPELNFELTPIADAHAAANQSIGDLIDTPFGLFGFGTLTCEMREAASAHQLSKVPLDDAPCEEDDDCVAASNDTQCHAACGVVTSRDMADVLAAEIGAINANFCAVYEEQCGPVIIPPCGPLGRPTCTDGRCVQGR